jgi:hypothetical protein
VRPKHIYDRSNAFVFIWRSYYMYRRLKFFDCDGPNSNNPMPNKEAIYAKT